MEVVPPAGVAASETRSTAEVVSFGNEIELWITFQPESPPLAIDEVVLTRIDGGTRSVRGVQSFETRTVQVRLTWHQAPRTQKTRSLLAAHTKPRP